MLVLLILALLVSVAAMPMPGSRSRTYIGVFVQAGKMAFGDGHEVVISEGTMLYHFQWRPDNLRYGCLTWLQSPSTCGVTAARIVRRVEP